MTKSDKPKCGGLLRDGSGRTCTRPAGWGTSHPGEGKCKLHGGGSPRGTESPQFKHGIYSHYMAASWQQKATEMEATIDLLPELTLMRVIMAEYMSRFQKPETSLTADDIEVLRSLADVIRKISDSIVKQRNSTALTAVEIAMLADKIPKLVVKYVQGIENQRAFIAELFSVTGGGTESAGEPQLTSGVIAHPTGSKR